MFVKKPFSFSTDCKALEQSLKKVSAVAGPTAIYFISIYKKSVCLLALSTDTFVLLAVPNSETSSTAGIFAFDQTVLQGLVKGRSIMEFKFNGSECLFSQVKGKYSGKITAVDVTEDQISQLTEKVQEKTSGASIVSSEVLAQIKLGLTASCIKDVYNSSTLLSFVSVGEGRLVVSSFDAQHFGLFRTRIPDKEISFRAALPQTHFSMVEQLSGGQDAKFSITPTGLRAFGKGFVAVLPATQSDDKHFSMVLDFIKALPEPVYEGSCEISALLTIADNLFTLYNSNANFAVKTKGQLMSLGLSTSSGSASDSFSVRTKSTDTQFSVDPRLFMDIVNLAKTCKTAVLRVTDKVFSITGKTGIGDVYLACSRVD